MSVKHDLKKNFFNFPFAEAMCCNVNLKLIKRLKRSKFIQVDFAIEVKLDDVRVYQSATRYMASVSISRKPLFDSE